MSHLLDVLVILGVQRFVMALQPPGQGRQRRFHRHRVHLDDLHLGVVLRLSVISCCIFTPKWVNKNKHGLRYRNLTCLPLPPPSLPSVLLISALESLSVYLRSCLRSSFPQPPPTLLPPSFFLFLPSLGLPFSALRTSTPLITESGTSAHAAPHLNTFTVQDIL